MKLRDEQLKAAGLIKPVDLLSIMKQANQIKEKRMQKVKLICTSLLIIGIVCAQVFMMVVLKPPMSLSVYVPVILSCLCILLGCLMKGES